MINSRKIEDLDEDTARLARAFVAQCLATEGIDVLITSTYRDADSQRALYNQGRSAPGQRVTNAGPGDSYHNWRMAFDFVPIVNGKAMWSDDFLWARCGAVARKVGLEWGGDWSRFADRPHCQNTRGMTIAQLKQERTLA